ncbi:hypothetical protein Y032_0007g3481 [Ancylostoma ceylanicum]|uniref:Tc1-like transposase DDE domain-containing protein n=1 Tax=Ancylostoma ceylanicum TaxID=53326 RepID=A0A016VMP7_9BILA|nr:hypothetical protein Y032_0007g3481 [Ancylostoma ceylanicum]
MQFWRRFSHDLGRIRELWKTGVGFRFQQNGLIRISRSAENTSTFLSEGAGRRSLVLQQDNAAVRVSHSTRSWLQEHRIQAMDCPACSPDCNPVENIWGLIVRQVYRNNKQYNTVNSLRTAILEAWDEMDDDIVLSLVRSMPHRIFEIIRNNGGSIIY